MKHNLLVLAAGYATRMGATTKHRAKPLLEVAGRSMMDWVLERFLPLPGLGRTVVVSNSKFIGDFRIWADRYQATIPSAEIELIENGSTSLADKRGAIGDLQFSLGEAGLYDEDLLVVGGDNLFEQIPYGFADFSRDKPAVIATYDVGSEAEVRRFASIETDAAGLITEFEN